MEAQNVSNAVLWFEVNGKDGNKLREFYGKLFDWNIQVDATSGFDYGLVEATGGGVGGGIGASADGGSGFATFYVEVDDIDKALEAAEELGGKTVLPATPIAGMNMSFAYLSDPEGHVIGLSHGIAATGGH